MHACMHPSTPSVLINTFLCSLANIQPGDIVTAVNGVSVISPKQAIRIIKQTQDKAVLSITREETCVAEGYDGMFVCIYMYACLYVCMPVSICLPVCVHAYHLTNTR